VGNEILICSVVTVCEKLLGQGTYFFTMTLVGGALMYTFFPSLVTS